MKNIIFYLILSISLPLRANNVQTVIHLLTYLSQDYAGAVQNGAIVSEDEYQEQVEFVQQLVKYSMEDSFSPEIKSSLLDLQKLVESKSDAEKVYKLATQIKAQVLEVFKVSTFPTIWPSLGEGKKIYEKNCLNCHGITGGGDGPDAKGLNPSPRSFLDNERMEAISPFQVFNTLSVGIEGTAMLSFPQLNEQEKWDVAFYVAAIRHLPLLKEKNNDFSLNELASKSDAELEPKSKKSRISYLRTLDDQNKENVDYFLSKLKKLLDESLNSFAKGEFEKSERLAMSAYLEGVEPIENFIKGSNLQKELEDTLKNVREGIRNRIAYQEISKRISLAKDLSSQVNQKIEKSQYMPFWLSFGVVFREAMESLLLIISIITIVRKANLKGAEKWIHGGWIFSILLGILGYIILDKTLKISGGDIEKMEGFVSLLAAAILLYVGVWFQRQSHMQKWVVLINQKILTSLSKGNLLGLATISFLVVFREVFETMLFVKILLLQYDSLLLVLSGIALAIMLSLIIGLAFLKFSTKLPMKHFFSISSMLILGLVLMLISKGVGALQKSDVISSTFLFNINMEVLVPQVLILIMGVYILIAKRKQD